MHDFPPFPIVIRRSKRLGLVLVFLTGLPLALTLVQAVFHPAGIPAPAAPSLSGPLGFVAVFLLGVLFLLRPARLILTPTGLTYERLLRHWRRSWRWHDVSGFDWAVFGSGKSKRRAIRFTSGPEEVEVADYWELPAAQVLALLNQARSLGLADVPAAPAIIAAPVVPGPPPLVPPAAAGEAASQAARASSPPGLKSWLAGLLLIGGGSLLGYLYDYKDNFLLQCTYILLIVFGWIWLGMMTISAATSSPSAATDGLRPATWAARLKRRAKQAGYVLAGTSWLVLLVGNIVVADWEGSQRVARILATEPTATTVATVTALRERRGRSSTIRSTLLSYRAGTEQVDQALPGIGQYVPGQRLRVRYAVRHPDMFAVEGVE